MGSGPLTHRQREVAVLIGQGLTNREIAQRLIVSERTVHSHVRTILNRLALTSRTQIATWTLLASAAECSDRVAADPARRDASIGRGSVAGTGLSAPQKSSLD